MEIKMKVLLSFLVLFLSVNSFAKSEHCRIAVPGIENESLDTVTHVIGRGYAFTSLEKSDFITALDQFQGQGNLSLMILTVRDSSGKILFTNNKVTVVDSAETRAELIRELPLCEVLRFIDKKQ